MTKIIFLIGLSLFFLNGITFADVLTWKTYTNMYDIREMVFYKDNIWCATNGGVFCYNTIDSTSKTFNNINGLSGLDIRAIAIDSEGDIWIGTFDGYINLIHESTHTIEVIDDYYQHVINDIAILNRDSVLIAFDNGIGLYVKKDREVKENYYSLGYRFDSKIGVNHLFIKGKEIWAGTDFGLARTSLEKINLKDPASWTNYTIRDSLPDNQIRAINGVKNDIFVLTANGTVKFDGKRWTTINDGIASIKNELYSFFENADTLYCTAKWGLYWYSSSRNWWYHIGNDIYNAMTMTRDNSGKFWLGRSLLDGVGGLAYLKKDKLIWKSIFPSGPMSNKFNSFAVDQNNVWWCATTDAGVLSFDGKQWKSYNTKNGMPSNYYKAVMVDGFNRVWAGSTGGGLTRIDPDGKIRTFGSKYLSGSNTPNFVVIEDIDIDANNNIWITNRLAVNNNIVAVTTPDSQWYYFSKVQTTAVSKLEIDRNDRIWVATDANGLYVLDYKGTLSNRSDDDFSQGLNKLEGLWSNKVTALKEDLEGTMWIGTDLGLNYWYSIGGTTRLDSFYYSLLISNDIQALAVDAQNNLWVGTSSGLSKVPAADRFRPQNFTTKNSPLVSDFIQSLTFNFNTGDLFIGTTNGLSVLETGLRAAKSSDYSLLNVFPNPFLNNGSNQLNITNLAQNSKNVKIYSLNGALVRNIPLDDPTRGGFGAQAIWPGDNDCGELVASGIYLIFAYTEDGKTHVAKVAVIRE